MTDNAGRKSVRIAGHLLGERIDAKAIVLPGYQSVMQTPRIFEAPDGSRVAIFRFGAVVIAQAEDSSSTTVPSEVLSHVVGSFDGRETEVVFVTIGDAGAPAGQGEQLVLNDFSVERFSIVASALAKSVALARDEQLIHAVFEKLEPFARELSKSSGRKLGPSASLKLLGDALLAQHRMVGRVEVHEKPEILWDRPDLVRLHARLDDEYELSERARELGRKLKVVEESARAIAEVADAYISRRLEIAIVALIMLEIGLSLYGIFSGQH